MPSFTLVFLGVLFLLLGLILKRGYPAKINPYIGYRTGRAMRNEESWKTANRYFGQCLIICGGVDVVVGLPTFKTESLGLFDVFNFFVLFIGLGLSIYLTERRLKKL